MLSIQVYVVRLQKLDQYEYKYCYPNVSADSADNAVSADSADNALSAGSGICCPALTALTELSALTALTALIALYVV